MNNTENKELFDLGSSPIVEDFDPFAMENELEEDVTPEQSKTETDTNTAKTKAAKTEKAEQHSEEKLPVFVYAGATETINDISMTFDELRIEKSCDFPELDDGKKVSWTVEYGKISKTVTNPKETCIGSMKNSIENSKEFIDSLKKAKDKNPVCKIKPRVTAQSKGTAYKGVFTTLEEAEAAGKIISIVPARDGKVYEIRDTEMGKFITPVTDCDMLSEVQAGFTPALPLIPAKLLLQVFTFFYHFAQCDNGKEALVNIYWDKENQIFLADAPEQLVSKISVDSKMSEKFADDRYIHYMDIHSHNTIAAFFSPVDDHDEKATRLYTVVGRLNKSKPEIKTRISNGGKFMEIDPKQVFEFSDISFLDDWINNVDISSRNKRNIRKAFSYMAKMEAKTEKAERRNKKKVGAI